MEGFSRDRGICSPTGRVLSTFLSTEKAGSSVVGVPNVAVFQAEEQARPRFLVPRRGGRVFDRPRRRLEVRVSLGVRCEKSDYCP